MGHLHLTARTTRPKRRSELACTACATTWARAAPRASISPARANSRLSPRLMSSDLRHYMGSRRPTRPHLTSPGQLAALAPLDVIRPAPLHGLAPPHAPASHQPGPTRGSRPT
ncbi:unnamed protein product [Linum trigynum]